MSNGNLTVFHASKVGEILTAEAKEITASRRLGHYTIRVTNSEDIVIANYSATAYRTGKPLPVHN